MACRWTAHRKSIRNARDANPERRTRSPNRTPSRACLAPRAGTTRCSSYTRATQPWTPYVCVRKDITTTARWTTVNCVIFAPRAGEPSRRVQRTGTPCVRRAPPTGRSLCVWITIPDVTRASRAKTMKWCFKNVCPQKIPFALVSSGLIFYLYFYI